MIDAGDLTNMFDVIRDLGERGDGPWVLRLPIRKSCFYALRLTDIKAGKWWAVEARLFGRAVGLPAIARGGYIGGREIDHDHSAVGRQSPQNVVGHISRMINERARRGMRKNHRCLTGPQ